MVSLMDFAAEKMTPAFKEEFESQLEDVSLPPGTKFASLMSILKKHNLAYTLDRLSPSLFLVHKAN